jgi:hypothetical protein
MAKKKSKNKKPVNTTETKTASSTRAMQVLFLIISALIVLSMILSATLSF